MLAPPVEDADAVAPKAAPSRGAVPRRRGVHREERAAGASRGPAILSLLLGDAALLQALPHLPHLPHLAASLLLASPASAAAAGAARPRGAASRAKEASGMKEVCPC